MRDALLFASIEKYCLRPIRNRPLIAYRFVNYLQGQTPEAIAQAMGLPIQHIYILLFVKVTMFLES